MNRIMMPMWLLSGIFFSGALSATARIYAGSSLCTI